MKNVFVPTVTINTDASFNHQHKIGGFAFYIRFGNVRIRYAAAFKNPVASAHEAEVLAIGNALHTLLKRTDLVRVYWLVVNSDCKLAMEDILQGKTPAGKKVKAIWTKVRKQLRITKHAFRHVKAHNGTPDARSYVNDWCDRQARKQMREQVTELKNAYLYKQCDP